MVHTRSTTGNIAAGNAGLRDGGREGARQRTEKVWGMGHRYRSAHGYSACCCVCVHMCVCEEGREGGSGDGGKCVMYICTTNSWYWRLP